MQHEQFEHYVMVPNEGVPHFGEKQLAASSTGDPQMATTTQPHPESVSSPPIALSGGVIPGQVPSGMSAANYSSAYDASFSGVSGGGAAYYASYTGGSPMPGTVPGGSTYFSAQSTGVPPSAATSVANYSTQAYSQGPVQQISTTRYLSQTREQQQDNALLHPAAIQGQSVAVSNYDSSSYQLQQGNVTGGSNSRYMSGAGGTYAASQYTTHRLASGATETSRVIGHEYGPERVISVQHHVDHNNVRVVAERWVEHEVRVPKRIKREEIIEQVIVRPETIMREEIIEETQKVREKIVEVAKPIIEETIIERPEIEIREKIIEVPEIQYKEKIREEIQLQRQERLIEVPVVVPQERIVEIPDIQYREVPVERIVEVPEIREEVVVRQVPVPQYVDKPVAQYVEVEVAHNVDRNIPVPVEAVVAYEFRIPKLKGHYTRVSYPVYLPRFIETPIPAELYNAAITSKAEHYLQQISSLTRTAASLCEIENLARAIQSADLMTQCQKVDIHSALLQAWSGGLQITSGVKSGGSFSGYHIDAVGPSAGLMVHSGMTGYGAQNTGTITTTTSNSAVASPSHHSRVQQRRTIQQSSSPVANH